MNDCTNVAFHRHLPHFAPVRRHNEPVVLHVTVCVAGRAPVLANENAQRALVAAWRQADLWRTGEYVIMPDHVHLFCSPGREEGYAVRRWVGYWKRVAGKFDEALQGKFQEDCWDTQMRDLAHYEEKLAYVQENPVRKGLANNWRAWPFRGQVNQIGWV